MAGVGQPHGARQADVEIARLAPAREARIEGRRGSGDLPTERLEQAPDQLDTAAARERGNMELERQGRGGRPRWLAQRPVKAVRNTPLIAIASMLDAA